jgi:hypothetical protein
VGTSLVVDYDKMFEPFSGNSFSLYPRWKAQNYPQISVYID